MTLLFAVLMGVIQGLTEFLPVSSSAHLRILPALLHQPDPGAAFTAVIQIGTDVAVVAYFWRDLWRIARATLAHAGELVRLHLPDGTDDEARDARLGGYILLGTLPVVVIGVLFENLIEHELRSLYVVATTLIVLAVILLVAETIARHRRTLGELTLSDALIIGAAQALAVIPGVSRSGVTLTAALFVGMRREDAARYSFLLSIPAVTGAAVFEIRHALRHGGGLGGHSMIMPIVVATLVSGLVGYAVIAWFLRFLRTRTTVPFVIWRVSVGGLMLALLGARMIAPF